MKTILDFTKEIVDKIRQYEDEFTLTFTPDVIKLVEYYEDEDWTVVRNIKFSNNYFIILTNYGGDIDNINITQFKTIQEAINFIFE